MDHDAIDRTLTCKRIEIVNNDGNLIMSLGADHYGKNPEIRFYNSDEEEILVMFARENNEAGLSILSTSGQVKVSMSSNSEEYGLVVCDSQGNRIHDKTSSSE